VWLPNNFLRGLYFSAGVLASAIAQIEKPKSVRRKLKGLNCEEIGIDEFCSMKKTNKIF
jgi:hypothetical protein